MRRRAARNEPRGPRLPGSRSAPSRPSWRGLALRAALCLAPLAAACSQAPEGPRHNVLLISIDTLRPDFLGCYGHERNTSPVLDRFASQGVLFEDVTSASPWTLPSHASMLTGLYPSSHGVKDHDKSLTRETLATRLKKAGYETMAVVNTHNIGDKRYGLLRGFERTHYESERPPKEVEGDGPMLITNKGDRITKRALKYLKERDPERPFFLFLHYYDVHTDFTPDPKWELEFVSPYDGDLSGNTQQLVNVRQGERHLSEADVTWLEEMYEAEIRTLDSILERIFDYLDATGLAESTVAVVTSDHGEEYMEHGSVLHGRTYYEEVIKIPLLVRGPGVPAGQRVPAPVHLIDVAPTIYSLIGVEPEERPDGIDVSPLWGDPPAEPPPRHLFAQADHNVVIGGEDHPDVRRMVRFGYEKLCYDTVTEEKELYDLGRDPGELEDLSTVRTDRVEALFGELQRHMATDTGGGARDVEPLEEDEAAKLLRDLERLGYAGSDEE